MKSRDSNRLKSMEIGVKSQENPFKSQGCISKVNSIQKKQIHVESPSSKNLIENIRSPRDLKLMPIQTVKNLHLKATKSGRPSPTKFAKSKKILMILSPSNHINNKSLKLPDSTNSIKIPKRRTQSTVYDPSTIQATSTLNFVSRCLYKTRKGSILGKKKNDNQDASIIHQNFQGIPGNYFFAVCDGHGKFGHKVSNYLKANFVNYLEIALQSSKKNENTIKTAYESAVKICEDSFENNGIDATFSGSTIVSVLIQSNLLTCINIGDSRAVIGKNLASWCHEDISRDHKPELVDESKRIINAGGRIFPYFNANGLPVGPYRVWLQEENIPGIAMSRSIGDNVATSVGVTSEPEIFSRLIKKEDKFIIIASDGL